MLFIHLKPEVEAIGVGGGDRGGISLPLFSLPGRKGGRDFYLDEFSNITTKIVNLKPKMRVIGAKEWIAVVTLHPSPAKERGEITSSGNEFDLSTYFNSHHLHIRSKPYIDVFHSFET